MVEEPLEPLNFVLPPVERSVELVSVPGGASVTIDGKKVLGVTPLSIELSDEEHELVISRQGYQSKTLLVERGDLSLPNPIQLIALKLPGTFRVEAPYLVAIRIGGREGVRLAPT